MALKSGRPSNQRTAKEKALEAVKEIDSPTIKMQRFNVDLPEQLHRDMKIQAAREGLKLNNLTVKIFNEYLSKNSID
jgi:predicted HicB family RNase H-like nuclease